MALLKILTDGGISIEAVRLGSLLPKVCRQPTPQRQSR
jgi:hypothetical protein